MPSSWPSCSNCCPIYRLRYPEIGTFKAKQIPLVVLTSNNAREMSDALKRRCLHLYIDFPDKEQELAIIRIKVPEAAEALANEVVQVVHALRKLDLKKTPGISETLDWVKALTLLNVQNLDSALVDETLGHDRQVRRRRAQGTGGTQGTPAGACGRVAAPARKPRGSPDKGSSDKDLLN